MRCMRGECTGELRGVYPEAKPDFLPHLPDGDFAEEQIRVYQCNRVGCGAWYYLLPLEVKMEMFFVCTCCHTALNYLPGRARGMFEQDPTIEALHVTCVRCGALNEIDASLVVRPAAPLYAELAVAA